VVGDIASIHPPESVALEDVTLNTAGGIVVQNDFKLSFMAPDDLREYAGLNTSAVTCTQRFIMGNAGVDLIRWALEGTYGTVEELPEMHKGKQNGAGANGTDGDEGDSSNGAITEHVDEEVSQLVAAYLVMGCITVRYRSNREVELEWEGNLHNDSIADSVMAVLMMVETSPAAVKRSGSQSPHHHHHTLPDRNPHANLTPEERLSRLFLFLEAQFGAENVAPIKEPKLPSVEEVQAAKADGDAMDTTAEGDDDERKAAELERLHKKGIPVPGISIKVDKMSAKVWLEDLEVESSSKVLADRVRAVVERACEIVAPLWR
jgi:cleavage and polyadenylation specificity factor subunit 3